MVKTIDNKIKYLIAGLLIIISGMLVLIIVLLRSRKKPIASTAIVNNTNNKQLTTVADLRDAIILHAQKHWQAADNITLNHLGTYLSNANYNYALDKYIALCNDINSALYAKGNAELSLLIHNWHEFKTTVVKQKSRSVGQDKREHVKLNPT